MKRIETDGVKRINIETKEELDLKELKDLWKKEREN